MVYCSILLESVARNQGNQAKDVFHHAFGHIDSASVDREFDQQSPADLFHCFVCSHVSRIEAPWYYSRICLKGGNVCS